MPLAGHGGEIARVFQQLGESDNPIHQCPANAGGLWNGELFQMSQSRLMWPGAGEKRGARWAAAGAIVELGEFEAARAKRINVGRGYFAAVRAEIRIAHVIRQNNDDIGSFGLRDGASCGP